MDGITILGAGKIGRAIIALLEESGSTDLQIGDANQAATEAICADFPTVKKIGFDLTNVASLVQALRGRSAVISALPFHCNPLVAQAAKEAGVHYFDLTEDVEVTAEVQSIAKGAVSTFIPQCGLAPGFVGIVGATLAEKFSELRELKLRVGALPLFPTNLLGYAMTWSTEGLINEYRKPCPVLVWGEEKEVAPLEDLEQVIINGKQYEAFNTSGGVGGLIELLKGTRASVNYKSIRYPGHCHLIRFLMKDLGFEHDPMDLKRIFELNIPTTNQDICILLVEAQGIQNGNLRSESFQSSVTGTKVKGQALSAIQRITAAGALVIVETVLAGKISQRGYVASETLRLDDIKQSIFAQHLGL